MSFPFYFFISCFLRFLFFFFFKQKTAYEMRISDWSSDVCSSDLHRHHGRGRRAREIRKEDRPRQRARDEQRPRRHGLRRDIAERAIAQPGDHRRQQRQENDEKDVHAASPFVIPAQAGTQTRNIAAPRSEEHTSELQSLMRN